MKEKEKFIILLKTCSIECHMREFTVIVTAKKCTKKRDVHAELLFCFFLTFSVAVIGKDPCFKAKVHRDRTLYQFILDVSSNIRRYCRFNSAASKL